MPVSMAQLCDDLMAETAVLEQMVLALDAEGWLTPTPAEGWSVLDQVGHLAFFDEAATLAATDPDRFRAEREVAFADSAGITETAAARYRALAGEEVLKEFRAARAAMLDVFRTIDPALRVPWYGPDMAVASSATARIMETWAHGQDVVDALHATRPQTGALRHVAHIGVRAFPNSFLANGLDVPEAPVFVELTGPDGDRWTWGPPDAADAVRGPALDFCLVVTRRRHVDDTALTITGPVAQSWMSIAQAFAGPPGTGRKPGQFS
jgi:uncharacterized protein (TIGR03084 family)